MTVAVGLVAVGAFVVVLCALAMLRLPDAFDRLHAVTPATSLGGVLICVGLAVNDATFHGVFKYLLTGLLLAVFGPASSMAAARAAWARHEEERP